VGEGCIYGWLRAVMRAGAKHGAKIAKPDNAINAARLLTNLTIKESSWLI